MTLIRTILFLFALCLSLRAAPSPSSIQSASVSAFVKQSTIQMQSAASSVVDTNDYWSPTFGWIYSGTSQTGFLFCVGTTKFVASATFPFSATNRSGTISFTNSPLEYGCYVWVVATNSTQTSPMSNWMFTPKLPVTQIVLSWPQVGTVQLLSAPTVKGAWSTYATVTTNTVTVPATAYYKLQGTTNRISYIASNPANTNGF